MYVHCRPRSLNFVRKLEFLHATLLSGYDCLEPNPKNSDMRQLSFVAKHCDETFKKKSR